jgi:dynein heavy chain
LNKNYNNLVGDALIAAGTITYLGVFTPDFRAKIVQSWQAKLREMQLPCTLDCTLYQTLANQGDIRTWISCGLPSDSQSIENGIMMSKGL